MTWFGGDPSVLGREFYISGPQKTVVGVMGPEFRFPQEETAVWIHDRVTPPKEVGNFDHNVVGRLSPGTDYESLRAELTSLARRLPGRFGGDGRFSRTIEQYRPVVRSLEEDLVGDLKRPLWILMGTVGIVLLIACANVANLLIVRAGKPSGRHGRAFRARRSARGPDSFAYRRSLTVSVARRRGWRCACVAGCAADCARSSRKHPKVRFRRNRCNRAALHRRRRHSCGACVGFPAGPAVFESRDHERFTELPSGRVGAERLDSRRTRCRSNCGGTRAACRLGSALSEFS